jgi:hypothetical protein
MAAKVKFILVLRFARMLNTTGTNSSFSGEKAWRELANDTSHKLQDIGCVEWNCWDIVPHVPFRVPAMMSKSTQICQVGQCHQAFQYEANRCDESALFSPPAERMAEKTQVPAAS